MPPFDTLPAGFTLDQPDGGAGSPPAAAPDAPSGSVAPPPAPFALPPGFVLDQQPYNPPDIEPSPSVGERLGRIGSAMQRGWQESQIAVNPEFVREHPAIGYPLAAAAQFSNFFLAPAGALLGGAEETLA